MRLQDLTIRDIKLYADGILQEVPAEKRSKLIHIIVDKADGVFLWVHYAVRSLMKGLGWSDDWEELEKRLELLPSKIEDLYHDMWLRLNEGREIYREEAALFFHIAIELVDDRSHVPSSFDFMIASDLPLQERFLERPSRVLASELIEKCERTEQRLMTRCAGLLEISDNWVESSDDEGIDNKENNNRSEQDRGRVEVNAVVTQSCSVLLERFTERKISFLHRTVRGFLTGTEAGQEILRHYHLPTGNSHPLWLRVYLVDMLARPNTLFWDNAFRQMTRLYTD